MTWTRLSDNFTDRPDLLAVSRSARLLHVEAMVWCNRQLTDGRLPAAVLPRVSDAPRMGALVSELLAAGIWTQDGEDYRLDWTDQEPSGAVRQRREQAAERQRRWREKKGRTDDVTQSVTRDVTRESRFPVPSRPVPTRPEGAGAESGARCPDCNGTRFTKDGDCMTCGRSVQLEAVGDS